MISFNFFTCHQRLCSVLKLLADPRPRGELVFFCSFGLAKPSCYWVNQAHRSWVLLHYKASCYGDSLVKQQRALIGAAIVRATKAERDIVTIKSTNKRIETYEEFMKVHGLLLTASGLPESLHKLLFQKLAAETLEGGHYFQIEPCKDGCQTRLPLIFDLMPKECSIFLIDHAWTFRLCDVYKQQQEVPGLVERMATLMCVDIDVSSEAEENGREEDAK